MAKEMTIAWRWVNRLDEDVVEKMQDDAVAVVEEHGEYVYIFEDGSGVYEKRRNDWYPAGTYIQCSECDQCVEARATDSPARRKEE
jgi:hypothetical protein